MRDTRFLVILLGIWIAAAFGLTASTSAEEIVKSEDHNSRYERGIAALKALDSTAAQPVLDNLKDISPEMARFIVEFAYGDVYSRPALDPKSRQLATIAALTALGNAKPQLKFHISAALNIGVKPEEIIEVMYVTTVFAGFPSGLNGISAAREVFQAKGVSAGHHRADLVGNDARRERGLRALNRTSKDAGERVIKSLSDIAPDMGYFIIDFSYGDIISRDILSPQHKEIAIIAVCVAKGTMEPQLKVHLHAALNVGCTKPQLVEIMNHMAVYSGFPTALNGLAAVRQVLKEGEGKSRDR